MADFFDDLFDDAHEPISDDEWDAICDATETL